MGRKRRHRDSSERLLKKLRRELRKRRQTSYSSSSDLSSGPEADEYVPYYECSDVEQNMEDSLAVPPVPDETILPIAPTVLEELAPQPSTSAAVEEGSDKNDEVIVVSEHLDEDILTLLGDAPKEETPVGKDIHTDIATRLLNVIQNGLNKEQKEKIIDNYPIPGNCQLFKAPLLNAEVKSAISEALLKKDSSLAARQGQLGVVLSALTSVMNILATEKSEFNQTLLKHISDACRLLCDTHYIDTKLRRNFLISTLNNKLKDTLKESKRDKFLFGETLPENLKASKAITKSSQELKSYATKPKPTTQNNRPTNPGNHLNWKHPQPNTQGMIRKRTSTVHRTAGPSTPAQQNDTRRKPTSSHASRNNAHFRSHRRQ